MDDRNKIIARSRIHGENSMLIAVDIFHSLPKIFNNELWICFICTIR